MFKTIDKLHIWNAARIIRKAQKKGEIERAEESELENISKQLGGYKLLCAIPDRKRGIYEVFGENQDEFIFKVLDRNFKERKSEAYSKMEWLKGVTPFTNFIESYLVFCDDLGYSERVSEILLKRVQAKKDPDLASKISSMEKFKGQQVLSVFDNETDYKVITQTDEAYGITTLDPCTLEEKASESYPIPTKQDKRRALPYKISAAVGGLAMMSLPFVLLGINKRLAGLSLITSLPMGYVLLILAPSIGSRYHKGKKLYGTDLTNYATSFNNELFKYVRIPRKTKEK